MDRCLSVQFTVQSSQMFSITLNLRMSKLRKIQQAINPDEGRGKKRRQDNNTQANESLTSIFEK